MTRRCFVIGPMHGPDQMERLHWLRDSVVRPSLPADFDVDTPDVITVGNIMNQVIHACDRSHLVVADTTGNNPNVLYEIAVLDAMGGACVPVRITDGDVGRHQPEGGMAFDRAQYRVFDITRADESSSRQLLESAIEDVLERRERGDRFENPLTDCFDVPLTEFTSATALAKGYYWNFVVPTVQRLRAQPVPGSAFDTWKSEATARQPGTEVEKALDILIPHMLKDASRGEVESLVKRGILRTVRVDSDEDDLGRGISFYEWTAQPEDLAFHWVDIPTTMYVLRSNVINRLGKTDRNDAGLYRELELDEIGQFERALRSSIDGDEDDRIRRVARMITQWTPPGGGD
jgi:hypothetical protein